jgi:hypothetical protein
MILITHVRNSETADTSLSRTPWPVAQGKHGMCAVSRSLAVFVEDGRKDGLRIACGQHRLCIGVMHQETKGFPSRLDGESRAAQGQTRSIGTQKDLKCPEVSILACLTVHQQWAFGNIIQANLPACSVRLGRYGMVSGSTMEVATVLDYLFIRHFLFTRVMYCCQTTQNYSSVLAIVIGSRIET